MGKSMIKVLAVFIMITTPYLSHSQDKDKFILVDLVVMNEGYGQQERDAYTKKTVKIAAKYGIKKIKTYQIMNKLSGTGPDQALELNLWEMDDPSAMQKLGSDPEYLANVSFRDKIHNMQDLTLYIAKPKKVGKAIAADKYVLVDLVVLNDGYGPKDRDGYSKETQRIAKKYGFRKAHSFSLVNHLAGKGPKAAMELNLWELPDPSAMQKLGEDAAYQANVPKRNQIHNMEALTLYLARNKTNMIK